jgi:hypothetical protein
LQVEPLVLKRVDDPNSPMETIAYDGSGRQNRAEGSEYRFVAISILEEGAAEYAATHSLGVPLYVGVSEEDPAKAEQYSRWRRLRERGE